MTGCRCCGKALSNGSLYCGSCWSSIVKMSHEILQERKEPLRTEEILYEICKNMDLADLSISYSTIKGKNRNLKKNIKSLLQRGPRSTSSIKNYFNGIIKEGPKKGRPRMKHGVVVQTLVNVLSKDPDITKIGKNKAGSYEEYIWTLTQHVEMVPALDTWLERRKAFKKHDSGKWTLPEWES